MARIGVTYADVARVSAKLAAEGRVPTVDTVREALGGTGSKSTIGPMLKRWKAEHQGQVLASDVGLPAGLLQAVRELHEQMQVDADQKIKAAEAAAAEVTQECEKRIALAQAATESAVGQRDTLQILLNDERTRNQELGVANHSLSMSQARLEAEVAGLTTRLEDRQAEIVGISRQLDQARAQFEHYQHAVAAQRTEERREAEQRHQRQEKELAEMRQAFSQVQQSLVEHQVRAEQAQKDIAALRQELVAKEQELVAVKAERLDLEKQVHTHTASAEQYRLQLEQANAAVVRTTVELADSRNEVQGLKSLVDRQQEENQGLQQRISRLEDQLAEMALAKSSGRGGAAESL